MAAGLKCASSPASFIHSASIIPQGCTSVCVHPWCWSPCTDPCLSARISKPFRPLAVLARLAAVLLTSHKFLGSWLCTTAVLSLLNTRSLAPELLVARGVASQLSVFCLSVSRSDVFIKRQRGGMFCGCVVRCGGGGAMLRYPFSLRDQPHDHSVV
jgi:hypothetical protein